ncbi:piriformospora indica-insensitive protein 2 [Selaginella moellendorffii]|uniref:piriformospora indica-insensitive protein 2 n=1 Tax=Selaginella moellendorffii TaxID=88036 RepID=UPI000D1D12A3|nr:piriformospora indica-insensitive protein 2 [Selaginella moellendorffii]|eukprot:XP_024542666.1 piriformospora indica-insensitive protein 2 [Selaginella moellendorffii]
MAGSSRVGARSGRAVMTSSSRDGARSPSRTRMIMASRENPKRHRLHDNVAKMAMVVVLLLLASLPRTISSERIHGRAEEGSSHIVHSDYEQPDPFMDPNELESLFRVMEALTMEIEWRRHYPHPCSSTPWPGIHCEQQDDGLSHVTRIDFGSLPNSTCKRNATMDPSLLQLKSLRGLFILNCFVDSKTTIVPGISKLASSLQMLSLRGNPSLVGEIPSEIGRLSKLEVLSLSQNGLSGQIPKELGDLAKVEHIDLSYNALSGAIPGELGAIKSLSILDLNGNLLSGHIPSSIGEASQLQKMDLSGNRLTGRIPSSLGSLAGLKFLALSDNELTGELPQSLANLVGIEYLILHGNPMRVELPDFWSKLTNLSELSLSSSGYFGSIPASLGDLIYLSELSLEDNLLNGSIPSSIARLSNIYHLNLSNNLLSGPVPFQRDFLYRLGENLDLRGNVDLCLTVDVPRNVSTKNLSSCSSQGSSLSSSSNSGAANSGLLSRQRSLLLFLLVLLLALLD